MAIEKGKQPPALELAEIPAGQYPDYRYEVIFGAYKWDPQVEDHNTIAKHVLLMRPDTAAQLERWVEALSLETMRLEEALLGDLALARRLGLPGRIFRALPRLSGYERGRHVRLMRFDFHPTDSGWALSEVNSDVPGGLAEASVLPRLAARYFAGAAPRGDVAESLLAAFKNKLPVGGRVAFVHATSYSDDRQVMQYIGDRFEQSGFESIYAAPDHLRWRQQKAVCIEQGAEGPIDGIFRFYPLEWLLNLPRESRWRDYYSGETPMCNHPATIFAQSKRLPLVWDKLGVAAPNWNQLLPETLDVRAARPLAGEWVLKPALGRVGEGISIREAVSEKEFKNIEKAARRYPKDWVAQRRFQSRALAAGGEALHLCVGAFAVDGKFAGFYARVSPYPRIDAKAKDIPVLVLKEAQDNG